MSRLHSIKEALFEIISTSTSHGLPNIVRSRRIFHKLLWLVSTALSCAFCAKFIYDGVSNYFDFPVVTVIETIYEQPTLFPSISICTTDRSFTDGDLSSKMVECKFNYDTDCLTNPYKYFESYQDSDYKLCYRFNSGKNSPLQSSTIGGMDDSLITQISTSTGLAIWVHNASSPPRRQFMNNHNGEINFASAGFTTHLVIEKTFDTKLGEPFNSCLKNVDDFTQNKTIINYMKNNNETYNRENCLELCFELIYLSNNECNCTNIALGKVWDNCFTGSFGLNVNNDCIMNTKKIFYKKSISDLCSNYCPIECDSVTYTVSAKSVSENFKNISRIFVYYRSLKYTAISQQQSIYLSDLVSNIGGILGLFIGISFLSFIEIIEFLVECLFILFEGEKNSKIINY